MPDTYEGHVKESQDLVDIRFDLLLSISEGLSQLIVTPEAAAMTKRSTTAQHAAQTNILKP